MDNQIARHQSWQEYNAELVKCMARLDSNSIEKLKNQITYTYASEGKIGIIGNGGSSAIAQHGLCDLSKGITKNENFIPRFADFYNTAVLTAISNDEDYDSVFSSQIKFLLEPKDLLILISSSGKSENIIKAAKTARTLGIPTFALVGFKDSILQNFCDGYIRVESQNYGIVEDIHMSILHSVSQSLNF